MSKSALACLALVLFFLPPARCQHLQLYTQKYTVNEGLADSYILNIFQDSQGFLWIGTAGGLSRFDGKEFVNYGYEAGLPDLRVDAIFEDADRRLWVGTRRGIAEIRGRKCVIYPMNDGLKVGFVFRFKMSPERKPWALTDKGLYCFDGARWVKTGLYPGMADHHCRDIVETPKGTYINYGDLLTLRSGNGNYKILGQYGQDIPYYNSLQKLRDSLYLSLPHGILSLHADGSVPIFEEALHDKTVGCYFRDSRGRFWINTEESGILISRPGSLQLIEDTIKVAYQLVSDIFEDREGNIWIACYNGLLKIKEVNYTEFKGPLIKEVRTLLRTSDGRLLAAAADGLLEYRDDDFVLIDRHFREGLPDDWCTDSKGRTWLMMRDRGIFIFDKHQLQEVSAPQIYAHGLNRSIDFNWCNGKIYLAADTLLLWGDEHGLSVFHEAGTGHTIVGPRSLKCLGNGNVLVWTADNHYYLIDTACMVRSVSGAMDIHQMSQKIKFYTEPSGKCWVIYGGGLARYHWNGQQLPVKELQLTSREHLPADGVSEVVIDRRHRLWAITSAGLVVIEPGSGSGGGAEGRGSGSAEGNGAAAEGKGGARPMVNPLSEELGIISDQWAHIGLLSDPTGLIWIYFPERIIRIDPQLIWFNHQPPPVTIEDIQLTRQSVSWSSWSDSLYGYRQLPHQLSLPYNQNSLIISYRAPCFSGVSGVEYSYLLGGADGMGAGGWSLPTHSNSVTFVKLSPGNYRFRVRARKSNTDWSDPAEFDFSIGKPWWEGWFFRGALLFGMMALIALFFWYRLRQVQRKAMVREQVRELELKALRAQMNPHFIYNALNSIQALVLDDFPEKATMYISKFSRILRQVLNHSERTLISLREELEALELYLQLEQLRLHVNLKYTILPDSGIGLDGEWVPPLILQPFAENSLWHGLSRKNGEKMLDILLHIEGEWLVVEIIDNGIGREQAARLSTASAKETSKGMEITGRRIRELNGSMAVTDLYDSGNNAAGTKVVLRLPRIKKGKGA